MRLHRADLDPADVVLIDGLPVTTAERTVVDLLAARADGAHVGEVIADADRRGLTNRTTLADRVARFTRAYGLPRSASGQQLLEYLAEQANTELPAEEATRLRQEGAVQGLASAFALLAELEGNHPTEAARRTFLQDVQQETAISSIAARIARDMGQESMVSDHASISAAYRAPATKRRRPTTDSSATEKPEEAR
ncbi:hypothetical protein [Nonomuraea sp. NPDC046570]|uniref:hypothetical protein n=1 Tax=Nonomuraea sp. NPDC046570 TaxID=3155255 RepID=UPI0033EEBB3D